MAKVIKKALPRGQRNYPQEARVVSTNFDANIKALVASTGERCFVPLSDYNKLEKKYLTLFKRYRRERKVKRT